VHTDVRRVGQLTLANVTATNSTTADVLNRVHRITQYAQLSNLWSIPTDCPQRERRGWTGDAQVSAHEAMLSNDMQAFHENFLIDIRNDQRFGCASRPRDGGSQTTCGGAPAADAAGSIADVVPYDGIGAWPGCPVWQVAYIVIARDAWRHYADRALLERHYPGFTDLMGYFQRHVNLSSGLLEIEGYGDWVCVDSQGHCPRTPSGSVSAFYYVRALGYLSEIAAVLEKADDAHRWAKEHSAAVRNFHARFYDDKAGGYSPVSGEPEGSQTSNAMGLALGAPPDAATRRRVEASLAANVVRNGKRFTFGIVGSVVVHPMLDAAGHANLALDTLLTDEYPSFGRFVQQNMTTLCENWKCTFHDAGGGSQNHIMFGAFDAWLVERVGGLATTSNATSSGWEHFVVHPSAAAVERLKTGGMSIDTRFGLAAVAWAWDPAGGAASLNVSVPPGSTATIVHERVLAGCTLLTVQEGRTVVWAAPARQLAPGAGGGGAAVGGGEAASNRNNDAAAKRPIEEVVGSGRYEWVRHYACA
jgi:alpha-L-rhamnosidase